jgi:NADPH2:quinone reductase
MKAITIKEYGAEPELTEVADPQSGRGQLLITVQAAGVNPVDSMVAAGAMRDVIPATFPLILGADFAGVVTSVGPGAAQFAQGQAVFGQLMIAPLGSAGTYAERIAVTADAPIAPIPAGLDPVEAAALPTAGVTALEIIESLEALAGKSVLLVGAAGGGVGSFATQLAVNAGARVIAVAGPDARDRMQTYKVAHTVDYTAGAVPAALARVCPDGVDVVIDLASDADAFSSLASLVRPGGTALTTRGVADAAALAANNVNGVNFVASVTSVQLTRLADAVVAGDVAVPPITRIKLDEVPLLAAAAHVDGKTVIVLKPPHRITC